eukprot:GHVL01020933.1.p1 GENE.GHVL01020933.1~~GHVL01020933.1.p1  ORF type:complete len:123 (-),score=17.96 GHVL01020933.1:261-629(-)
MNISEMNISEMNVAVKRCLSVSPQNDDESKKSRMYRLPLVQRPSKESSIKLRWDNLIPQKPTQYNYESPPKKTSTRLFLQTPVPDRRRRATIGPSDSSPLSCNAPVKPALMAPRRRVIVIQE